MAVLQPTENSKPFWLSKTMWANLLMGVAAFFPKIRDLASPEVMSSAFVLVNMILRLISSGKVTLK